jgi:predicted metalloendopeptidase
MGATIGHELTHGFDDQGRQFDKDGNLKNWWTKDDEQKFNERAECMVKQYDAIEAVPGVHLNGKLTLGENLADLGGLVAGVAGLAGQGAGRAPGHDGDQPMATRRTSASGLRMRSSGARRRGPSSCAPRRRAIRTRRTSTAPTPC